MRNWRKEVQAFLVLMGPGTFWLVAFFLVPVTLIWIYSFLDRGPQGQLEWVFSFDNYVRALEPIHLGIMWKSLWIAALSTALCLLLGFPMAMGVAFAPARWKNFLLLLVALPFFTNLLIRTYAWIAILRTRGYVNETLGWFYDGIAGLFTGGDPNAFPAFVPIEFLYNQYAIIVGLVYVGLPFLILPLYASLEKFDRSFLEASLDLGASQWQTFFQVLVPIAMPGIIAGSLLVFIISLGTYLVPDVLGGTSSEMIGTLIARQFGASRDWPFGSALSCLLLYITFIVLWLRAVGAGREAKGAH
jgi:spermidine/putrescine transport system permease protein